MQNLGACNTLAKPPEPLRAAINWYCLAPRGSLFLSVAKRRTASLPGATRYSWERNRILC